MVFFLNTFVVILKYRYLSLIAICCEMNSYGVIILRCIGSCGQGTEVGIHKSFVWDYFENDTFIFVRLSFPFTLPYNGAAFLPVGCNSCSEHVFFNNFWINQSIPYFSFWNVYNY